MTQTDLPPVLTSSPAITRHPKPVLTHEQIPYPATLVFNAGVCKYQGRYVMLFRNDYGRWGDTTFDGTNLGLAFSKNGVDWEVEPKPVWGKDDAGIIEATDGEIRRVYDPRLTVIEGSVYVCFACDTHHGLRGGVAVTEDFEKFEVLSLSAPDNRNMVLFPERIGGKYARLERPMPVYSRGRDRFDMWFCDSPDLRYWGNNHLVAAVEQFRYANDKIGPGAPPIKTEAGWLAAIHLVDRHDSWGKRGWENAWRKRYWIGLVLLDLERPWKVIGRMDEPLIAPETKEETDGFRNDVLFPGGMILEESGEVKIYYGAADTVECLATAEVGELVKLCKPIK